jgi:hypothetical protein
MFRKQGELVRHSKGIFRNGIYRFESYMPSQAVGPLPAKAVVRLPRFPIIGCLGRISIGFGIADHFVDDSHQFASKSARSIGGVVKLPSTTPFKVKVFP